MNVLKKLMLTSLASAFVLVAMTGIKPYCWYIIYEPDVPECLKK
ncbi:MAG: cyclic lactone autoinducer peptide [Acidobacteriota bacterium]